MGLGACMHIIYSPLVDFTLKFLEIIVPENPFSTLTLSPFDLLNICVIGPIIEELGFREFLQDALNNGLTSFYLSLGLSNPNATLAARITSIFFTSILFGLIHFTNALFCACSPMIFLPQVIACIIMGVLFGLAKELTGGLSMPIGMHMGNNIFACAQWLYSR